MDQNYPNGGSKERKTDEQVPMRTTASGVPLDGLSIPRNIVTGSVRRQTMASRIVTGLPEAIIPNCLLLMIAGILGCLITTQFGGLGILTFVQVATLGVSAASLSEYQTDRGLWMLAILMVVVWGGLHALGLTMQTLDAIRGVQTPVAFLMDGSLATFCTTIHLRFLLRVAHYNFRHVS